MTKISDPDPGLLTRVSDLDPNNGIVPRVSSLDPSLLKRVSDLNPDPDLKTRD